MHPTHEDIIKFVRTQALAAFNGFVELMQQNGIGRTSGTVALLDILTDYIGCLVAGVLQDPKRNENDTREAMVAKIVEMIEIQIDRISKIMDKEKKDAESTKPSAER